MKITRLSDQANEDLVQIWEYIAENSLSAADRMVRALVTQYKSLADNPGMGQLRPELRPGLRSFPVDNYLLLYHALPEGVAIARILHGARDLEALFKQEGEETYRFDNDLENLENNVENEFKGDDAGSDEGKKGA